MDILETESNVPANFFDAVLSVSVLGAHLGVVAPSLKLEAKREGVCIFEQSLQSKDLTLVLDDKSTIAANRATLIAESPVFAAMLDGRFSEAEADSINIPFVGHMSLVLLLHYLYGCRWCPIFADMPVSVLLEMVSLTDQYLLPDFNESVCHEIVQRCLLPDQVVEVYEKSLQSEYPVHGAEESLSKCAVNHLLVGEMSLDKRASVYKALLSSGMNADFLDDLTKTLRGKLLEHR